MVLQKNLYVNYRKGINMRPSKEEYYMNIAKAVSERSTCLRRKYGAIIIKDDAIVSTGYNGSYRGAPNCCDLGYCKRQQDNVPHGERYELCNSVHAENNAIINASRIGVSVKNGTLYLYGYDCELKKTIDAKPCMMCERVIANAGIKEVISSKGDENV